MPTLIGICGGSAAGKTLLATELQRLLGNDATILSQDRYYCDIGPLTFEQRLEVNLDCPEAIEEDRFVRDLKELRAGRPIRIPNYDYASCSRTGYTEPQKPRSFVLIEGLFLLTLEEIRQLLDFSCFIDSSEEVRVRRILHRDLTERGKTYEVARSNLQRYVLPMHQRYIKPFKKFADLIVRNDGDNPSALQEAARAIFTRVEAKKMKT